MWCNPCSPDDVEEDGSQCIPCNPCSPDQLEEGGRQSWLCNPCGPDTRDDDGSQCIPCNPCSPDQRGPGGDQCFPCNPCAPDQGEADSSSESSSGCFLTSACVESMGLADDCDELMTLRALRDKRRLYDSSFDAMVKEYYQIAPKIVAAINALPDRKERYAKLYQTLVQPSVAMVKANRENDAVAFYRKMVLTLKRTYLGDV